MHALRLLLASALLAASAPLAGQTPGVVEFEPKVGTIGTRVSLSTALPKGATVRFGARPVSLLVEPGRRPSFVVPDGSSSGFLEVVVGGSTIAKSAVPFVVSGPSVVQTPKLIGLREAIDVFGYAEPIPEGGTKPETTVKPILSIGDGDILTIGEPGPQFMAAPVQLGDVSSAATRGMGAAGFLITARPPKKKVTLPAAGPSPTPPPEPGKE